MIRRSTGPKIAPLRFPPIPHRPPPTHVVDWGLAIASDGPLPPPHGTINGEKWGTWAGLQPVPNAPSTLGTA
ncbi:MAG: hypothetical protein Fur0042_12410 [Cyanophyceae cyanobacterium]